MTTKKWIIKQVIFIMIIASVPPAFALIGLILLWGSWIFGVFNFTERLFRLPTLRTLSGVLKRIVMTNKQIEKGVIPSNTTSSPLP
jgi:hypothetical protein